MKFAIITGAGTGIGKAIAHRLLDGDCEILGIGRRIVELREMQKIDPQKISVIAADLSKVDGRKRVVNYVRSKGKQINFLVHNAGVLAPTGKITEVASRAFKNNLAINLEAPLFLTRELLPKMITGGRILHISSGAAHSVIPGWGAYCIAKAALFMLYQVLKEELVGSNVIVGSFSPGIVDTPMQEMIRSLSKENFPQVELFRSFKEKGKLSSPEKIADCINWLLRKATASEFGEKDWSAKEIFAFLEKND
ncbi:MAG: hypothetical protein ACD_21C00190G0006 [uncultured bacterium]|nr:MAG: hypothetical protein ACD_21C00190G0006 [uncultured bacterium]